MPWVKLDDQFPDHEKLARCEVFAPLCGWLYVCGLAYCNRQLTDGLIPKGHIHRLVSFHGLQYVRASVGTGNDVMAQLTDDIDVTELAKWLVAVGLWEDSDADYLVHDYLSYQPSRAEVLEERAKGAHRLQQWRGARGKRNAVSNAVSNAVTNAVTNTITNGVSTPAPVPVPEPDPKPQEPRAREHALAHEAPTSTQHYAERGAPTHASTDDAPVVDAATGYVIGHARMGAGRSGGSLPGRAPHAAYQCEAFTVPTFLHQKFLGRLQNVNDASPEATLQAWYRTLRDRMAGQETPAKEVQWLSDEFDAWRKPQPVMGVRGSRTTGNAAAAAAVIARIRQQAAQEAS